MGNVVFFTNKEEVHVYSLIYFYSIVVLYLICYLKVASVMSNSLRPYGLEPTRLLCPSDSPGKNTGVGCHTLLQGIFPTQRSNPDLLHCRLILYHLSHPGTPVLKITWSLLLFQ